MYRFRLSTITSRMCLSMIFLIMELDVRSHLLSPLYESPYSRWSPSTYARPYSWHRAGEGRTRLSARRDARTLTHWLATPHTLLPFRRVLARNRASGEDEKREIVEEEVFAGLLSRRESNEHIKINKKSKWLILNINKQSNFVKRIINLTFMMSK